MIARPNYSAPESAFVYESCVQVAREALRRGRPVILDGTFARSAHRARAVRALSGLYGRHILVHVVCSMDTAKRRNSSREEIVPEERLRGIYASFEQPTAALQVDSQAWSAEENAAIISTALTHGTTLCVRCGQMLRPTDMLCPRCGQQASI
jgi:predicted kinase